MIKQLKEKIEERYNIDLKDTSRRRDVVNGRMAFAKICRDNLRMPYMAIGKEIGKDHATIIHYLKNFEGVCKSDSFFNHNFKELEKDLNI